MTLPANTQRLNRDTLRLDHESPVPLHAQAEQALRALIQRKDYRTGGLLPDEVSLSRILGVSRNTLRAAILRLVAEGRLERQAGVGTRVIKPKVKSGVGAWHSFTHEMERKGIRVETYSVSAKLVAAPPAAGQALRLPSKTRVLCLDRVRGWDARPEVVFRSYLHPRLKLSPDDNLEQPLYELIHQRCSILADESFEEFSAVAADEWLAHCLSVRVGTPLLRRERTVLDTGRKPIEFAVVHYRCERFKLTLTLRQEE